MGLGPLRPQVLCALLAVTALALVAAGCGGSATHGSAGQAAGGAGAGGSAAAGPMTPARARAELAFGAFNRAFYVQQGGVGYDKLTTAGRRSDFWRQAEFIELAADAYQHTGDPAYKAMVLSLRRGVSRLWGVRWTRRTWNDDIMWMVLASIRAYQVTGVRRYLDVARANFDATYARAWSSRLGGGLWWTTAQTQKNNTTNGPAALAALLLYQTLHDRSYLVKAERLFGWVQKTLYDPRTGALADSISITSGGGTVVNHVGLTYNYGSFIGAAGMLYQITGRRAYFRTGLKALEYAKANLTYPDGILRSESHGRNENGGGFKGIFCRWALRFVYDNHLTRFLPWFRRNAQTAWSHRNGQGLMGQDWSRQTPDGMQYSFDCYSGVALLEALAGR